MYPHPQPQPPTTPCPSPSRFLIPFFTVKTFFTIFQSFFLFLFSPTFFSGFPIDSIIKKKLFSQFSPFFLTFPFLQIFPVFKVFHGVSQFFTIFSYTCFHNLSLFFCLFLFYCFSQFSSVQPFFTIFNFFNPLTVSHHFALVLLSANAKRFRVSNMQDFCQ